MLSLANFLANNNLFVTRKVKSNSKMWYIYSVKCLQTHGIHQYKMNLVLFLPDGNSFEYVLDDSIYSFLYDMLFRDKIYFMPILNLK